jgi:(+)-trans-carveol dehydrogenase
MNRLAGKVAFITGAARGQGRSHAIRLAEEGADIIAVDLASDIATVPYPLARPDDLEETVRQVEAMDRRIVATTADVRDYDALKKALDAGVDRLGRVDIVSANAGIFSSGPAHELDDAAWGDMIDVNLSGVWRTAKAAIPHLIEQGDGGAIILTASVAGLRSYANVAHYVAAKHGVVGLMKALAQELAPHRVRVNALAPTQVDTAMIQNEALYKVWCPDLEKPTQDDFAKASRAAIPLDVPWVEPVDVSNAVVFLASDEARYITGVCLPVDGGVLIA